MARTTTVVIPVHFKGDESITTITADVETTDVLDLVDAVNRAEPAGRVFSLIFNNEDDILFWVKN